MSHSNRHSVSVAAVITNGDGHVLVIQRRDNGHWQIPGGILELDESIEDGLRREVREETGIEIEPTRLTGVYKNMSIGVVALVFTASHFSGEPTPTDESAAVEWWPTRAVDDLMTEAFAIRIKDAINADSAPVVRHHDGTNLI